MHMVTSSVMTIAFAARHILVCLRAKHEKFLANCVLQLSYLNLHPL